MLCFVNNNVLIWLNKCSKSGGDDVEVGAALSWTLLLHYLSTGFFLQLFFFTLQDDEAVHSQGSSQKFALL